MRGGPLAFWAAAGAVAVASALHTSHVMFYRKPDCLPAMMELMESRRLLSGVTLITHGQGGHASDKELKLAADLIARRAGGAAQYVMTVNEDGVLGAKVGSFTLDPGSPSTNDVGSGETIIRLDWSDVKTTPTPTIGQAVADYMLKHRLVEQQLHLLGPSRGASIMSNLAGELGRSGVWVDHVTYIDPVPVNIPIPGFGDLVDGPMRVTENVVYADDYWRSDDNIATGFDGQPVRGAYNVELTMVQQENAGDPHVGAGAYYIATIDPNEPIVSPVMSSWFQGTKQRPARDQTGYRFSRIVGGGRSRAGVSKEFGGVAKRDAVNERGAQWPNIDAVKVVGTRRQFVIGDRFNVSFRFNDSDSATSVTLAIDNDRNPYNNWVETIARRNYAKRATPDIQRVGIKTATLGGGTYFLAARIKDASGHVRYAYSPYSIDLAATSGSARSAAPPTRVVAPAGMPPMRFANVFHEETEPPLDQLFFAEDSRVV
jgi:hypothetical protein